MILDCAYDGQKCTAEYVGDFFGTKRIHLLIIAIERNDHVDHFVD